MATRAHAGGASAPSSPAMPLDVFLAALPSLPRPILSRLTARIIERLDELDGDPDEEATNDEGEPDFRTLPKRRRKTRQRRYGPGCILSDDDSAEDDRGCDGDEGI